MAIFAGKGEEDRKRENGFGGGNQRSGWGGGGIESACGADFGGGEEYEWEGGEAVERVFER